MHADMVKMFRFKRAGKKADLSEFECAMVVGVRRADLSVSETPDLLGFSHTTFSKVYRDWSKKERTSNGRKCLVEVRGQENHQTSSDRKTTLTQTLITTESISEHATHSSMKQKTRTGNRLQFTQTHQNWTIED